MAVIERERKVTAEIRQEVVELREKMKRVQVDRDRHLKEQILLTERLQKAIAELIRLKAENAQLAARHRGRLESVARPSREGLVTAVSKEGRIEISIGTEAAVLKAITDTGASSIRDMGKVMGTLKSKYTGQMDFGKVGPMVKARLA
jgi:uncharacterized protein YqeY